MLGEWTALPVGIVIAMAATMVGLGGGILWTPYLIFVAGLEPFEAVLASLVIQVFGMGSGSAAAIAHRRTTLRVPLVLAAAALPGVLLGVWLQSMIHPDRLVFLLGCAAMATAMIFVFAREDVTFQAVKIPETRQLVRLLWVPPLLSILTGLLSVGIGDFFVPVLRNRLGMKMDAAIATCLVVMTCNAALAAVVHIAAGGRFPVALVLWAAVGVLIGGQAGPRIAGRIPDQTLKEVFIYGLSLVGVHLLFNS